MDILNGGLVTNNSIRLIQIERQKFVTTSGWGVFFDLFSNSACSVEKIHACHNEIGDDGAISLGDSFVTNSRIKRLNLNSSRSITQVGWQGFSKGLRSPNCSLLELDIARCGINDEGALAVASALVGNTSLEILNMSDNWRISSSGWIDYFYIMRQDEIRLAELNLSNNNIDDLGVTMLVTILVKMSALDSFCLCRMTSVSSDGWREFADVVNPIISSSKLRVLELGGGVSPPPEIDASVISGFAYALIGNTSLSEFYFGGYELSGADRRAMVNALCDKSSPNKTFGSNHTLISFSYHRFYWDNTDEYKDLRSSLVMNGRCKNKARVAREKILAIHLGDDSACVRIFAPMPTPMLPTALSWIGRYRKEYSMMYHLLHSMPHAMATRVSEHIICTRTSE